MDTYFKKISQFLIKYRFVLIPLVPAVFVLIIFYFAASSGDRPQQTNIITTNTTPTPYAYSDTSNSAIYSERMAAADNFDPDELRGVASVQTLPGNTTQYVLSSHVPSRPNIILVKDGVALYKRILISPDYPLKTSGLEELFGKPKWIFKGSRFYGPAAETYIYAELGFALVANPDTKEIYEQHLFSPLRIEDYVKNYGDDLVSQLPKE